jgi:hypothetical protein
VNGSQRPCYSSLMSPDLCREARAILKWTRRELADAAAIPLFPISFQLRGICPSSKKLTDGKCARYISTPTGWRSMWR